MAYIDCPSCGQRADGKATRCPECGLIFTPGIRQQSIARPGLRMLRRGLVTVGALGALAVAVVVFQGRGGSGDVAIPRVTTGLEPQPTADDTGSAAPAQEEQTVAAPPPTPTRPAPTPTPPRDTAPPVNRAQPLESPPDTTPQVAAEDSVSAVAQAPPLDTTPAIEAGAEPPPVGLSDSTPVVEAPRGGPLQRYARTWVSIREGRSDSAAAVRTLSPGEAVLVDSLSGGWYRVVVDGRTEGYVDGSYLSIEAP
ncbi:MAG: SH3 domain-containing protein [Gemmatimonadales bacterium]|nr:SH3 domain-containing protein [Gemmatimonadales bacterium]